MSVSCEVVITVGVMNLGIHLTPVSLVRVILNIKLKRVFQNSWVLIKCLHCAVGHIGSDYFQKINKTQKTV